MGLIAALYCHAGGRRKLWSLDLSNLFGDRQDMVVWGTAFSPDESKLAIGVGPDPSPKRVVIVALDRPRVSLHKFEFRARLPLPSGKSITWSPSGRAIVVSSEPPIMLRLGTETTCSFPKESRFGGFLSNDRILLYSIASEHTAILILRDDCSVENTWISRATVLETSPVQDVIAIQSLDLSNRSGKAPVELIDSKSHKVKQRWIWDVSSTFKGGFVFSDRGKLVCSGFRPEGERQPHAACWDTQTGARTAENNKAVVDHQSIQSAGGELLAITTYKYIYHDGKLWKYFDMDNDYSVPQRQLIWDVRNGEEVASWGVSRQTQLWQTSPKFVKKVETPFVLSLSVTAKYLAESGSGSVSVYSVHH